MPRAGSSSVHTGIDAKALRALRRDIKALKPDSPEWAKKLGQAYKNAGLIIVADAQRRAKGMGGQQAAMSAAISASAVTSGVSIRVANSARTPFGLAAFWGQDKHTGWFARGRYANSHAYQHDPWVGASWTVGQAGEGPYAVNDAIAAKTDEAMAEWAAAIEKLFDEVPTE